ncbi:MAG: hypothetical protein HKN23_07275 [Verrucomicrobiales bacterium]|nr:hypothetical protein [Verrucomicrobiales bacterium]
MKNFREIYNPCEEGLFAKPLLLFRFCLIAIFFAGGNSFGQLDGFPGEDPAAANRPRVIHLIVEWIEVEQDDLSDWIFENPMTTDGTPLRKEVQKWVKAKNAEVIQTVVLQGRSGNRVKVESITEFIYPTEFDPAEIPNQVDLKDGAEAPVTGVNPTAFETRHLGTTVEADMVLGQDGKTVDINLSPEIVQLAGYTHWPHADADPKFRSRMPTMKTMKVTTQIAATDGGYAFVGTIRRPKPGEVVVEKPGPMPKPKPGLIQTQREPVEIDEGGEKKSSPAPPKPYKEKEGEDKVAAAERPQIPETKREKPIVLLFVRPDVGVVNPARN